MNIKMFMISLALLEAYEAEDGKKGLKKGLMKWDYKVMRMLRHSALCNWLQQPGPHQVNHCGPDTPETQCSPNINSCADHRKVDLSKK